MWEFVQAGGWIMGCIGVCSLFSMTIIGERAWSLRQAKILGHDVTKHVLYWVSQRKLSAKEIERVATLSPLGSVLAKGIPQLNQSPEDLQQNMQQQGRQVVLNMEKYLNTLGTLATITPLLGLLGTVMGMIQVFSALEAQGATSMLADGIAKALITTAFGLIVAIPSLVAHRYFHRKIEEIAYRIESESKRFLDTIQNKVK